MSVWHPGARHLSYYIGTEVFKICKQAFTPGSYYVCIRVGHQFQVIHLPRSLFAISKKSKHRFWLFLKKPGSIPPTTKKKHRFWLFLKKPGSIPPTTQKQQQARNTWQQEQNHFTTGVEQLDDSCWFTWRVPSSTEPLHDRSRTIQRRLLIYSKGSIIDGTTWCHAAQNHSKAVTKTRFGPPKTIHFAGNNKQQQNNEIRIAVSPSISSGKCEKEK